MKIYTAGPLSQLMRKDFRYIKFNTIFFKLCLCTHENSTGESANAVADDNLVLEVVLVAIGGAVAAVDTVERSTDVFVALRDVDVLQQTFAENAHSETEKFLFNGKLDKFFSLFSLSNELSKRFFDTIAEDRGSQLTRFPRVSTRSECKYCEINIESAVRVRI